MEYGESNQAVKRRIDMAIVAIADIQKFVADVAREFLPEKVILFGSYATGSAKAESDVDLLVVMREDVSGARVAADIIMRLKPTLPVELVVRSSRQIKERLALNDFFLREIIAKRKELYAAPHH